MTNKDISPSIEESLNMIQKKLKDQKIESKFNKKDNPYDNELNKNLSLSNLFKKSDIIKKKNSKLKKNKILCYSPIKLIIKMKF